MSLTLTIHSPEGGAFDVTFDDREVKLGRASYCGVRLPYPVVSSHHLTIRGEAGEWCFYDVGTTNGTVVDGRRLSAGEEVWIRDGLVATIVDVSIEFRIVRDYVEGFTLAESGTMLRQMVSESASTGADDDDLAFFEVLEGPGIGRRFPIPDDVDQAVLGPGRDCGLRLTALDSAVLSVDRDGEGFRVRAVGDGALTVNGESVAPHGHRLRSSDRIRAGELVVLFVDPLEAYLQELDADAPQTEAERREGSTPSAQPAESPRDQPPNAPEPQREEEPAGLTVFEWILLAVSVVVIVAGVAALLVILDVV
jgi:predicted component of type VI protein secretion system